VELSCGKAVDVIPDDFYEKLLRDFKSNSLTFKKEEKNWHYDPDGKEWAHDTLLEYQIQDPEGAIAKERTEKRRIGLLKFVCHDCGLGNHEVCKERNKLKRRSDCDCGHKTAKEKK
jgi:hypothetical protein